MLIKETFQGFSLDTGHISLMMVSMQEESFIKGKISRWREPLFENTVQTVKLKEKQDKET